MKSSKHFSIHSPLPLSHSLMCSDLRILKTITEYNEKFAIKKISF